MLGVDDYIFNKEEPVRSVLDFVHQHVHDLGEQVTSSIKWRIPYYVRRKGICYTNVLAKMEVVELNFPFARAFDPAIQAILDYRGRSSVAGIMLTSLERIDVEKLDIILQEALRIDDLHTEGSRLYW